MPPKCDRTAATGNGVAEEGYYRADEPVDS